MASSLPWKFVRRAVLLRCHLPALARLPVLLALGLCLVLSLHVLVSKEGAQVMLSSQTLPATPHPRLSISDSASSLDPNSVLLNLKASVDNQTHDDLADMMALLYNLPLRYGLKKPPPLAGASRNKCAKYPSLFDLSFSNTYWQVFHSSNGTFYLYNAFFDNRTLAHLKPSIRILGMADRLKPAITAHCQLWYEGDSAPVVAKVVEYRYVWTKYYGNYRHGILQPYLIQCVIPNSHHQRVPQSVSLVEGSCDKPTNNLRVIYNLPPTGRKENFAVCVKGLDLGPDISLRIVEWLELLFLLGADRVFLYDLGVHPNISKVMRYYESQGRVDIVTLTLPGEQPSGRGFLHLYLKSKITHKRQNEIIPYNDCLYRNMYRFKFITLLDIDEVIMPRTTPNWRELMEQVAPEVMRDTGHPSSSYVVQNVYFLDSMQEEHGWARDVPLFMHMLQHVHRASNYTKRGHYVKCFHDPQRVLSLHNHFPFSCLAGACSSSSIPTEVAHLQHYRRSCVGELRKVCPYYRNHTVLEDSILRFKEPLVSNTLHTLRHLGFLQA